MREEIWYTLTTTIRYTYGITIDLYYSQIKIAQRFFDCGFAFAQNDTFALRCHPERSEGSFHFLFENSMNGSEWKMDNGKWIMNGEASN